MDMLRRALGLFLLHLYGSVEENKPILFYFCCFLGVGNGCCEISLLSGGQEGLPLPVVLSPFACGWKKTSAASGHSVCCLEDP